MFLWLILIMLVFFNVVTIDFGGLEIYPQLASRECCFTRTLTGFRYVYRANLR